MRDTPNSTRRFRYLWSGRFWLASLMALILAIVIMASMSLWLPEGPAAVDNLIIPLVIFPLIWALCFFYAVMDPSLKRATLVMTALLIINGSLVAASIMGMLS